MALPGSAAVPGERLGRYTLLGKLAVGGMAEVYLARQDGPMGFAKTVVIKRILPQYAHDEHFLQMFLDEARLAALINHPHVVSIYELGEDKLHDSYFMAMEYIDGRNLKQVATRALELGSQLSSRVCARIAADAAAGLEFAHTLRSASGESLNLVHRDISAENILMSYSGMVKVVDFGIAKAAHLEGRTKTGQVKGKVGYMAPEQLLGDKVDRRADIWALGITLYWLLSGQRPFRGESEGRIIQQVVSDEVPPLQRRGTQVPPELEQILRTALAKDPAKRFQSAGELQTELERWLARTGEPLTHQSLAGVMEQLFPETADRDRVLTRALLQGEAPPAPFDPSKARPSNQRRRSGLGARRWGLVGLSLALAVGAGVSAVAAFSDRSDELLTRKRLKLVAPPAALSPPPSASPAVPAAPSAEAAAAAEAPAATPSAPGLDQPATAQLPAIALPTGPGTETGEEVHPRHRPRTRKPASAGAPVPDAPAVFELAPAGPPGELAIDARPWAEVTVDGREVGTTPFAPISLPAGRHRVELTNPNGARVVRTIEVSSGRTLTLREKMVPTGE